MSSHEAAPGTGEVEHGQVVLDRVVGDLREAHRLLGRVVRDLGEASSRGLAERLAGLPLEQLVTLHAQLPGWEARRLVGAAEVLADMPGLWEAVTDGRLAWASVSALARAVRGLTAEQRRWVDATLTADDQRVDGLSPEALVDVVSGLADRARPDLAQDREQRSWDRRFVSAQLGLDGSASLYGELDAVSAAPILAALDHAGRYYHRTGPDTDQHDRHGQEGHDGHDAGDGSDGHADPVAGAGRSRGRRQADGLMVLAVDWLAGHTATTGDGDDDDADDDNEAGAAGGGAPAARRTLRPARPSMLVATDLASLAAATGAHAATSAGVATAPDQAAAADNPGRTGMAGTAGTAGPAPQAVAAQLLLHAGAPVALTPTALALLACEARITPVLTDGDWVLGVGRATEHVPRRRARGSGSP